VAVDSPPPTVRPSGTIALFAQTADKAIEKLDSLRPTQESSELRREAVALRALFRSWDKHAPKPTERAHAVSRLMDMYSAIEEYAAQQKP